MLLSRPPLAGLRPFVKLVWAGDGQGLLEGRERVLPTGSMHLVIRLSGPELLLYADEDDTRGARLSHAVVGGARERYYLRQVEAAASVGAQLFPGAAELLLGVPAGELADRHTALDALWGPARVAEWRDQLAAEVDLGARLRGFERLLGAALPRVRGVHPAVAQALATLNEAPDVASLAEASGYSHRRFIALFRDAVGLAPNLYRRILRFQDALSRVRGSSLSEAALAAGYSDQSHLNRDFREFAGVSPGRYRELAPAAPNHVPAGQKHPRRK